MDIARLERDQKLFQEETYRLTNELENLTQRAKVFKQLAKDLLADYNDYMKSPEEPFIDTTGAPLLGKDLGRYLASFRSDKDCAEPKVLGTYHSHTVYVHSVGGKTQFGMVGQSGRHYGSKSALPMKHEAAEEWLANQGPLWKTRSQEAKSRYEEQQATIQELSEALPQRVWKGKQTLDDRKAELKSLNEHIRQTVDVLDGLSPDDIEVTDVILNRIHNDEYELIATVGDHRISRYIYSKYVRELQKQKYTDEEIARRYFVWGNPDYINRKTDQEHLKIYYEQWLYTNINLHIPHVGRYYGTLQKVEEVDEENAAFPSVNLVIKNYYGRKQTIRVSYENKMQVEELSHPY